MRTLEQQREKLDEEGWNPAKRKAYAPAPILHRSRRVVQRLISKMRQRGIITVFIKNPVNPARYAVFAERMDKFDEEFREFATNNGAIYWEFPGELGFEPEDFQDNRHMGSDRARRRFQRELMRHAAALFREKFPDEARSSPDDDGSDTEQALAPAPPEEDDDEVQSD